MNENFEHAFSNYGVSEVNERLELIFPSTDITIERIGKHTFSYFQQNSEGKIIEKTIPAQSNELKIEIPFSQRVIWKAKDYLFIFYSGLFC
jgi:hypothetical protein